MSVESPQFQTGLASRWRDFAIEAHGPQLYGKRPYHEHLDEGASLIRHLGYPSVLVAGFFLHDVPEDTSETVEDIEAKLNPPLVIISGLRAVTSYKGEPWDEKLAKATSDPIGHVWKLADAAINLGAKISNPDLGKSKRLRSMRKYAYFLGVLEHGLPTPHAIREHIARHRGQ